MEVCLSLLKWSSLEMELAVHLSPLVTWVLFLGQQWLLFLDWWIQSEVNEDGYTVVFGADKKEKCSISSEDGSLIFSSLLPWTLLTSYSLWHDMGDWFFCFVWEKDNLKSEVSSKNFKSNPIIGQRRSVRTSWQPLTCCLSPLLSSAETITESIQKQAWTVALLFCRSKMSWTVRESLGEDVHPWLQRWNFLFFKGFGG
jgi:hypothetical protein